MRGTIYHSKQPELYMMCSSISRVISRFRQLKLSPKPSALQRVQMTWSSSVDLCKQNVHIHLHVSFRDTRKGGINRQLQDVRCCCRRDSSTKWEKADSEVPFLRRPGAWREGLLQERRSSYPRARGLLKALGMVSPGTWWVGASFLQTSDTVEEATQ